MNFKHIIYIILFSFILSNNDSGSIYRKSAIHNANLVKTVFTNSGIIGLDSSNPTYPRGAWIYDTNGYFGDISLLVGAEVTYDQNGIERTFRSVTTCPINRPSVNGPDKNDDGTWATFEPVGGYLNPEQNFVAMSTNPDSWPKVAWPDDDCDWSSEWCGYFGKDTQLIQQESYFVMNDNNDREFNGGISSNTHSFDPGNGLNGLGLEVKVRGMQWQQILAQDCLFFLYEITNKSNHDYKKVVFGELVGTFIGATGYGYNQTEWDDDWSFFDVNSDMTYTGDFDNTISNNPSWVGDVGMVGFAFLESPGNPYDGIDNDGDYTGPLPLLTDQDFDEEVINIGDYVITIDDEYRRTKVEITDAVTVITSQGIDYTITAGETSLAEGNEIETSCGNSINQNAYNGLDDDLDGLIDENYYLHYYQKRFSYEENNLGECEQGVLLFDELNPRAYVNYLSLENNNGYIDDNIYDLIDERRDDGIDNDGDWDADLHDVGADGIADSGDFDAGELNGVPDPGEPNFDSKDPDESDQIGLTSFDYFTPAEEFPMDRDDDLWEKLSPGEFDVQETIVDGEPIAGEDGDFMFGSGYFPLKAGDTQRFSIAIVYGANKTDLDRNRETVQYIYDKEYKFPPPPEKPTLTAVAGDSEVRLYWDRIAEAKKDPVLGTYDFQGYKVYKATDPNFNDIRNITNAYGIVEDYSALAQFDLDDEVDSLFYANYELFQETGGLTFNLGENTGLQHSYIDTDVINGRTYYYAVTAYDSGDVEQGIFPSENSKYISVLSSGDILTDINTAVVTPTTTSQGLEISDVEIERLGSQYGGTGNISCEVVNPSNVTGHNYLVEFWDTSMDQIDNNYNGDIDNNDLNELLYPTTTYYSVYDETLISVPFELSIYDSRDVNLDYKNIVADSFELYRYDVMVASSDYEIISVDGINNGVIRIVNEDLIPGDFNARFHYFPIYQSPYIDGAKWIDNVDQSTNQSYEYDGNTLWLEEVSEAEVFDGLRLNFDNDWETQYDNDYKWTINNLTEVNLAVDIGSANIDQLGLVAYPSSNDLRIEFYDNCIECEDILGNASNFKIHDITRGIDDLDYVYTKSGGSNNTMSQGDLIYIFESFNHDDYDALTINGVNIESNFFTWTISFIGDDVQFSEGDALDIYVSKPFRYGDQFLLTSYIPDINTSSESIDLSEIKVVPNPYVAATALESSLSTGITSGRGERKIEFQNVPSDAVIKIYNIRGQHITTLNHDGDIFDGSVEWNLRTKENMDIAYGVYLYVVESSMGVKKGKVAIIK